MHLKEVKFRFGVLVHLTPCIHIVLREEAVDYHQIFFETLLEGTADEPDSSYGLIASSMEYPKDRSELFSTFVQKTTFSDGNPLTAEDVVFSYEILRDKGLPSFRAVIEKEVESAEALSTHRVKFVFKDNIPTRDLPQMVGGLPIFSKKYYL